MSKKPKPAKANGKTKSGKPPATKTKTPKAMNGGKAHKPKEAGTEKKPSGLDGAARVLKEAGKPLNCKAMVSIMLDKSYWKTGGKTPWATLYSAILREINEKKGDSRFKKVDRGLFAITGKAVAV